MGERVRAKDRGFRVEQGFEVVKEGKKGDNCTVSEGCDFYLGKRCTRERERERERERF